MRGSGANSRGWRRGGGLRKDWLSGRGLSSWQRKGWRTKEIAVRANAAPNTVGKWRRRFAEHRLDGLMDEPRPGAPRQIGDAEVAEVVRRTLETAPKNATHWSLRSMAEAAGFAPSTIHRIWKAFNLQPHRTETFKLSTDPLFVEKVRDVVGLYLSPPEHALVLCVDEKSQIQALDRSQPVLPHASGTDRATNPCLYAPWNAHAVCGPRRRHRRDHRALLSPPSRTGILELPARDRAQRPE